MDKMPLHQGKAAALICRSYCGSIQELARGDTSRQIDDLVRCIEQEKNKLKGDHSHLHCWLEELCVVTAQLLYTCSPRLRMKVEYSSDHHHHEVNPWWALLCVRTRQIETALVI